VFALAACAPTALELSKPRPDAGSGGATADATDHAGGKGNPAPASGGAAGSGGSSGSMGTGASTVVTTGGVGSGGMGNVGFGGNLPNNGGVSNVGLGGNVPSNGGRSGVLRDAGAGNGGRDSSLDTGAGGFECDQNVCLLQGAMCCGADCAFTRFDPFHCGDCDTVCTLTQVCEESHCVNPRCEAPMATPDSGPHCGQDEVCCFGKCCNATQRCCDDGLGGFVCRGLYCLPD
jgi:hypothetical protein